MKRVDIQRLRESSGLSLNKLARELGVGRRTIMRWLNGSVEPSPLATEQLKRLQDQVGTGGNGHEPAPATPRRQDYVPAAPPLRGRGVVPSASRPRLVTRKA